MKRVPLIDDAFLRLETRRMPLHIGVLMLFEPPAGGGRKFAETLAARLREQTTTVRPFNQCLVRERGMHYWQEDTDFDLDQHFVHLSLPAPGRIRELLAFVSRVHPNHLDRAYPLWRMYLLDGLADGRVAVYIKIHHAMVDGVSGIQMLVRSMATDAKSSTDAPPFWAVGVKKSGGQQPLPVPTPAAGGITALRSLAREGLGAGVGSVNKVVREVGRTLNDYWRRNPDLALGGQAPRCQFNDTISGSRRFAAQSYATPRIKAVAEACAATSNDVILAMCGGALRRYLQARNELPDAPLMAAVPVSVRREGHHTDAANEVAFTMAHLATQLETPLQRLTAIKRCMDYNKRRIGDLSPGQLLTYEALMLLPGAANTLLGFAPNKTLANVCISHVPGPRQDLYWQGARLCGLYPVSLVIDGGALNITVVSRHDFVDFGIIACRKTVPEVQRLLDYLEDALTELENALASGSTEESAFAKLPRKRAPKRPRTDTRSTSRKSKAGSRKPRATGAARKSKRPKTKPTARKAGSRA